MMKMRCGNMEEENKYWRAEAQKECIFCGKEGDNMEHYVYTCAKLNDLFVDLGNDKDVVW